MTLEMVVWEMVVSEVEDEMLGAGKDVYVRHVDPLEGVRRRVVRSLGGGDLVAWGVDFDRPSIFGDDETGR